jgi:hemerythrin-like metal-binding protein
MTNIQWLPIYSVHVRVIDAQHQRFVGIINQLDSAIREHRVEEELGGIFEELIAYAKLHFETEEMYMERFNYEGTVAHKEAHAKLAAQLAEYRERYVGDKSVLSTELAEFLFDWLTHHTVGMDKLYTQCFHEHGLT